MPRAIKNNEDLHKRNVQHFFARNTLYWDRVYSGDDQSLGFNCAIMEGRRENVLRAVDDFAGKRKLRVLDVGCGPGVFMEEMLARGHRATGIDLSREMVDQANARLERFSGNGKRVCCAEGNIEALPFADETVDLVLCLGVLMYLQDEHRGIREIKRVLKKGGMAVVVMTNLVKIGNLLDPYYYLCRSWQYLWYQLLTTPDSSRQTDIPPDDFNLNRNFAIKRYTLGKLGGMFDRHGLAHTRTSAVVYGPPTIWRKSFLPLTMEKNISSAIDRLSRKPGFSWLKMFANEWVLCFVKK